MAARLDAVVFAAHAPRVVATFWGALLASEVVAEAGGAAVPTGGFRLRFVPSDEPKTTLNPVHLHLTSAVDGDQQRTVEAALALGGRHLDVGQLPEEDHIVLADPEGNEFCVIEAGNRFLADTAFLGEVACDGTRDVGLFWAAALGWPLVWDQDEETSIQSPAGGTKVSWGGPPVAPKHGRGRVHLDLVADADDEPARLTALGATRSAAPGCDGATAFADPDGNEFCLFPSS